MIFHFFSWLFTLIHAGQTGYEAADDGLFKFVYLVVGVLGLCLLVPYLVGMSAAKAVRMRDYGWKLGLMLISLLLAAEIVGRTFDWETYRFDIKLGVDLKGGVILIYEVADDAPATRAEGEEFVDPQSRAQAQMGRLIGALSRRINPSGTKEIVVREYGGRQVEIIIPEVDPQEVAEIKRLISKAGVLEFRIVANPRDHADVINLAREMAEDPVLKRAREVRDETGKPVGLWARVGREDVITNPDRPFKLSVANYLIRDASSNEIIEVPSQVFRDNEKDEILALEKFLESRGTKEIDVLMATNDGYNVTGRNLAASKGRDELTNPCINFTLSGPSVDDFADLTRDFKPDGNFERQLGILLDKQLLSAPNIREMIVGRGRITGKFSEQEVDFMVNILTAGSLPMILNEDPISENIIDPLLGQETIEQGRTAIGISLGLVLVFILFYYRFSGFVAAFALLTNLLLILALMVLIKAAFTLPGLAGLVLTVGMSVDANVLIFERIREELKRGAALRMAIRNGFSRATTTIVDANVTTLITAIVLYAIGTDQIRGFAVTLILGILMSMYTAIFCSRVIFDIAERWRRMSTLGMTQILGTTQIDFIGKQRIAGVASAILIVVGLVGLVARGADILDIDFKGGTSVHVKLTAPMETEDVRDVLDPKFKQLNVRYTLTAINATGTGPNEVFKEDSAFTDVKLLQNAIREAFAAAPGSTGLATYSLQYDEITEVALTPEGGAADQGPAADAADKTQQKQPSTTPAPAEKAKADSSAPATAPAPAADPAPAPATKDAPPEGEKDADKQPAEQPAGDGQPDAPPAADAAPAAAAPDAATPAEDAAPPPPAADDDARSTPLPDQLLALADDAPLLVAQAETDAATPQAAPPPDAAEASDDQETADPRPAPPAGDEAPAPEPAEPPPTAAAPTAAAPDTETADEQPAAAPPAGDDQPDTAAAQQYMLDAKLTLPNGINYETLKARIQLAVDTLGIPVSYFDLLNPDWQGGGNNFDQWTLRIAATHDQTTQLLDHLKTEFAETPVWPSSNSFGPQVAGQMREKAIYALLTSLLGIVVYIWIRFQRVVFGLAAVVALVHDVLVTLGAIALSYWLAGVLGFLLIEEFKISLPIVAALLTIIGYSLNDTIVVFDRIREVRGKSPDLTGSMINTSINQTLSRTILTSLTTLIVVVILYAIGGEGIHGFAFALVVGVTVGTYSSIFVASPALLWMAGAKNRNRKSVTA